MSGCRSCNATILMSRSLGQEAHKPWATPNTGDGPVKSKLLTFQCFVAEAKSCRTMLNFYLLTMTANSWTSLEFVLDKDGNTYIV